jgi:translation initiation factor IF-1
MQSKSRNESRGVEEKALIKAQFKVKCHNFGVHAHNSIHCKARKNHGNIQIDANHQPPDCVYCRKSGHFKSNYFI